MAKTEYKLLPKEQRLEMGGHSTDCTVFETYCTCDYRWSDKNFNLSGLEPLPIRYLTFMDGSVYISKEDAEYLRGEKK